MARLPRKTLNQDGTVTVRLQVPSIVWEIATRVGESLGELFGSRSPTGFDPGIVGMNLLLTRLNQQAAAGDMRGVLGVEWQQALDKRNGTARDKRLELPAHFDRSVLHTEPKRKSGYYGVYTYGYGFQARARHESGHGEIVLGNFPTAELAALTRYDYYLRKESLAYGEAELEVLALRKIDQSVAQLSDAELWPEVLQHLQATNRMHEVFGLGRVALAPGPRKPQLDARRAKQASPEQAPPAEQALERPTAERVDLLKGVLKSTPASAPTPTLAPIQSEPAALGFEDGLPETFNDDWKPRPLDYGQPKIKRPRGRPPKNRAVSS